MKQKVIYTATAAPGAGKSEALIRQIPEILNSGKRLVIALPTIPLAAAMSARMAKAGLKPRTINSATEPGKKITESINQILKENNESLLIITHEALHQCNPENFKKTILVIDEIPNIISFTNKLLDLCESKRIFEYTQEINGRLFIKPKLKTELEKQTNKYRSNIKQTNSIIASTLSELEFTIFTSIIDGHHVYVDRNNDRSHWISIIIENKIFEQFEHTEETHLLAANIDGGIFDIFARTHGYTYKTSRFTPPPFEYGCKICIHVMLNGSWSKTRVLEDETGNNHGGRHLGEEKKQVIDKIFNTAISHRPHIDILAFHNSWANWKWLKSDKVKSCKLDSRGIDDLSGYMSAVLLFSGKPSPRDKKNLDILAKKYGIPYKQLHKAMTTSNKLECSLQAVTRTAVRNRDFTGTVHFYVQDREVAHYLVKTYMQNATIDYCLAEDYPAKPNKKAADPSLRKEAEKFIAEAISSNAPKNKTIAQLMHGGIKQATAYRWYNQQLAG